MSHVLQIGSVLLLAVGVNLASAQKASQEPPPPAAKVAKPVAKPAPAPKGGTPKGGTPKALPKGSTRVVNPTGVATRLFRMTPEQRERALEPLPPDRQAAFRKTLEWFDSLPKEQQEMQIHRIERFDALTPEKKAEFRQLLMALNQLPGPRQNAIGRELYLLQEMPDKQRENTLKNPRVQERFTPEELRILNGLADAWNPPL